MPDDSSPLLAPHGVAALPDKRQVAASFSRAAASYDAVAELQRGVGESLLSALPEGFSPRRWVDLGCGTGYFSRALERRFGAAEGLAVDIAEGTLPQARASGRASPIIRVRCPGSPRRSGTSAPLLSPSC
ncbi:methyltransferase domain-containing protein, partial [Pseudomonas aeruginosa]|uniref:methyltransferase domain-containing protein n=1 Tax=Pseudomonas aeruginosa TaxID=287 RepID=UPI0013A59E92